MAKKQKKDTAHRVPPLSGVDTAIYLGGIAMICGVGVGYVALVSWLSKYAALRDPAVSAYVRTPSSLLFLPFLGFLTLGCLLPLLFFFKKRKPILGSKRIHYGEAPWKADWKQANPLWGGSLESRMVSTFRSPAETASSPGKGAPPCQKASTNLADLPADGLAVGVSQPVWAAGAARRPFHCSI